MAWCENCLSEYEDDVVTCKECGNNLIIEKPNKVKEKEWKDELVFAVIAVQNVIIFIYYKISYSAFVESAKNHIEPSSSQISFIGKLSLFSLLCLLLIYLVNTVSRKSNLIKLKYQIPKLAYRMIIATIALWTLIVLYTTPGCPICGDYNI